MESIKTREEKVRRITTLINACKLRANKDDLIERLGCQNMETMTEDDIDNLWGWLEAAHVCYTAEPSAKVKSLRHDVLNILTEMGIYRGPKDWPAVNRFLLSTKVCGRLLYMLHETEFPQLIKRLRAIQAKDKKVKEAQAQNRPKNAPNILPIYVTPGEGTIN